MNHIVSALISLIVSGMLLFGGPAAQVFATWFALIVCVLGYVGIVILCWLGMSPEARARVRASLIYSIIVTPVYLYALVQVGQPELAAFVAAGSMIMYLMAFSGREVRQ